MLHRVSQTLLWLCLGLGSFLITLSSIVYFNKNERAAFIIEKLPLPAEDLYVLALRLHVAVAALALPGCLILATKTVLKRWPTFHRWLGRSLGSVILAVLVPTGVYLAFFARGGWLATLGFLLTGAIVLVAMIQGIRAARARDYVRHRRLTFHVLGQLSVAVTSRAMLIGLEFFGTEPDFAYLVSLWIPVVGTFALVEYLASPIQLKLTLRSFYEKTLAYAGARSRGADSR